MHMNNVDDLFAELSGNPENFCQWDSAVELTPACTSAEGHDPMRAAVATAAGPSTLLAVGAFCSHIALKQAGLCDCNAWLLLCSSMPTS
jgi:hypothetical protein